MVVVYLLSYAYILGIYKILVLPTKMLGILVRDRFTPTGVASMPEGFKSLNCLVGDYLVYKFLESDVGICLYSTCCINTMFVYLHNLPGTK